MIIENEIFRVHCDIFDKRKFEISYREWEQEQVHNKKVFVYDIGLYFFNNNNKGGVYQSLNLVLIQECFGNEYKPLRFVKVSKNEEDNKKVFKREVEKEQNNLRHLLLEKQTLESIEVDYTNFRLYSQSLDINPNKNVYIINFINDLICKETELIKQKQIEELDSFNR